ncbi:MAG: carbamoyl phosphate synthase large subunit, partial [Coriobacteriaceae bacterium]|nr:carbamoyl phosphate synthase large subunit [Coriobacteriaceae bacterium]
VIELNPRASRTVPFSSKATGVPLARCAARIMSGETIAQLGLPPEDRTPSHYAVKEAVMPWSRFPGADVHLGPEMKSTGEVMGIDTTFPKAYAKTREAIDYEIPMSGKVFVSVCDRDKRSVAPVALSLTNLSYDLVATRGTAKTLRAAGIPCEVVRPISEGSPNVLDMMAAGEIAFIVNTPRGGSSRGDGAKIRGEAVSRGVDMATTMSGATALIQAIAALRKGPLDVYALQDL